MVERLQPKTTTLGSNEHRLYDEDPNFDRKLDAIVTGGHKHLKKHLLIKISKENCHTIVDYILAMQQLIHINDSFTLPNGVYRLFV